MRVQGLRAVRVFRFRCLGFRIAKPGPGLGGCRIFGEVQSRVEGLPCKE